MNDLISRQAAIDVLLGITPMRNTIPLDSAVFNIKKLPSVEPDQKTGSGVSEGVYIKGVEMPARCDACFAHERCLIQKHYRWGIDRPDNCPLVPVPPHGDLIERKAIDLTDFEIVICDGNYKEGMKMLLEKIESAPTIIPAEE